MRKSILIIAAAAMLASCWETEKIGNDMVNDTPAVIGFNTISENATKANVENLENYHGTFNVYSTKKSNNSTTATPEVVFNGDAAADLITFDATKMAPNNWTYSPYRYWDKQATYAFVAVAPNSNIVKFTTPDNVANAEGTYVTANAAGYTLVGQNLQSAEAPANAEIRKGFTGADGGDTDIMTAEKITRNGASAVEDVNLQFRHILAKLNIAIAKDPTFDNVKIVIKKVQVVGLDDTGIYNEAISDTQSAWTNTSLSNNSYALVWENADGIELPKGEGQGDEYVPGEKLYFIESLVMPQTIEQDIEKLIIDYTIVNGDLIQKYNYELKFNDGEYQVFEDFRERNNYTISLTVRPNVITFDASAILWEDKTSDNTVVPVTPLP